VSAASVRHFLTLADVAPAAWPALLRRARVLKAERAAGQRHHALAGKTVALVFEKASTRTRVSFEVGVYELGGHAVVLSAQGSQIARGEPIEDTARVLSGYCHGIVLRTFGQDRVVALAGAAAVPVINGLTDQHHPCQLAADLMTVVERFGGPAGAPGDGVVPAGLRYAWIGDGNNMAHSWIEAAGLFGLDLVLACPDGYQPDPALVAAARARGGRVELTSDPMVAARGADVVSTDVWASMGQEEETARRKLAFRGYCVDAALMAAASTRAIALHCLPAHRGEEISGEVLDGPQSAAWQQAENRLHAQKALLEHLFAPPA
jgi:ornithine carbamoyltransferase